MVDPTPLRADLAGSSPYAKGASASEVATYASELPQPNDSVGNMSDTISRDELSARLEAVEARTETRIVELSGKVDRLVDAVSSLSSTVEEGRSDNKFTRWTIAGLAVGMFGVVISLISLIYTAQGTMTTANGNVLSAFQAGQSSASSASVDTAAPTKAEAAK